MSRIDRAVTLHTQGDHVAAEAAYRAMIADGDDVVSAANNLFLLLRSQRRFAEIAELYRLVEPHIAANHVWAGRISYTLLSNEEYEAGWQWYEVRRYDPATSAVVPNLSIPKWSGEPIKRLLVWREQGFGDEIQFARFVPEAARRGIEVTLLCDPTLSRLFQGLPAQVVGLRGSVSLPGPYDAWCFLGSLPLLLGPPFEIPPPVPVSATPRGAGGVGVMTSGSTRHPNDANRSMPPDVAARLLQMPGAVSLRPEDTGARDFQDTADIIAGLDCVVTVDTSVAHLAGSLGKPTFVLLPAVRQDWRWQRDREDSPWYPSVRLFRQTEAGGWDGLIERVLPEIAALR